MLDLTPLFKTSSHFFSPWSYATKVADLSSLSLKVSFEDRELNLTGLKINLWVLSDKSQPFLWCLTKERNFFLGGENPIRSDDLEWLKQVQGSFCQIFLIK